MSCMNRQNFQVLHTGMYCEASAKEDVWPPGFNNLGANMRMEAVPFHCSPPTFVLVQPSSSILLIAVAAAAKHQAYLNDL